MGDEVKHIHRSDAGGLGGLVWFAGWLFTIGYLHLPFGRGLLALVLWPYYLGVAGRHV